MNKPNKIIRDTIYLKTGFSCYTLQEVLDLIPKDIPLSSVYFETELNSGYYGIESADVHFYYHVDILNPNYVEQLKIYKKEKSKERFINKNKLNYFKDGEEIYLQKGHQCWLDNIELAPLKKQTTITIDKVLDPYSANNKPMNQNNWCQVVYYTLNNKQFSTILYAKDVLYRKDWT